MLFLILMYNGHRNEKIFMEKVKVGDELTIHCYKHNGKFHRSWEEALVLYIDEEKIIVGNNKTKVTESDGRTHKAKEPAIVILYKNSWFNVFGQLKKKGLFYKCNIASPYIIDEGAIKFIDYDLDLKVFPDGGFKVLDRNEYKYHKKIMGYSDDLDKVLTTELTNLINLKRKEEGPFLKGLIEEYYEKYKLLR